MCLHAQPEAVGRGARDEKVTCLAGGPALVSALLGFPCGSAGKESTYNEGDLGLIPRLGRSPGGGHGNPLQYSRLENVHGQGSLAGCSPWGCKESDTTEQLSTVHTQQNHFQVQAKHAVKETIICTIIQASIFKRTQII